MNRSERPTTPTTPIRRWPLWLIAAPAAVAIWSGWVGLGELCGFGPVRLLPGITDWTLNTAITLPIGVEAYAAYALGAWMSPAAPKRARRFAKLSALGALAYGMLGQIVYHLLAAAHATRAPVPVVVIVSCMPVAVLGLAAGLTHLLRAAPEPGPEPGPEPEPETVRQLSVPRWTDAQTAAIDAQIRATEAGNPYKANALGSKFRLSRAEATKVVETVESMTTPLPSLNGSGPHV